jgi:hypothetical protein
LGEDEQELEDEDDERPTNRMVDDEDNPYLREFNKLQPELIVTRDYVNSLHATSGTTADDRRVWCARRYAFAVPTDAALATLARYAPIVELGAGTGYWAFLLRRRGVDCVAYDLAPPDRMPNPNRFRPLTWTHVEQGDVDALAVHGDRALFLCWPSYREPFADRALAAYAGTTLLYIGEPPDGHTADDAFFAQLDREWLPVEQVALPNWPGTHDTLVVYRRKVARVRERRRPASRR